MTTPRLIPSKLLFLKWLTSTSLSVVLPFAVSVAVSSLSLISTTAGLWSPLEFMLPLAVVQGRRSKDPSTVHQQIFSGQKRNDPAKVFLHTLEINYGCIGHKKRTLIYQEVNNGLWSYWISQGQYEKETPRSAGPFTTSLHEYVCFTFPFLFCY